MMPGTAVATERLIDITTIDNNPAESRAIFPKSLIFIGLRLRISHTMECDARISARIAYTLFH